MELLHYYTHNISMLADTTFNLSGLRRTAPLWQLDLREKTLLKYKKHI